MSETKTVSEREAVQRERAAFILGFHTMSNGDVEHSAKRAGEGYLSPSCKALSAGMAKHLYPLPKVSRPRVVQDCPIPGRHPRHFRVINGQLQTMSGDGVWHCLDNGSVHTTDNGEGLSLRPERVRMLADLLANPTEEVEG